MRLIIVLTALLAVSAFAAPAPGEKADLPPESSAPADNLDQSVVIKKLTKLIDLWHDANLKGDGNLISKRADQITELLKIDIRNQQMHVDQRRVRLTNLRQANQSSTPSAEERALLAELARADDFLKVKKRLLGAFQRSPYFSNKYRLISDYLEILRLQQGNNEPVMAESDGTENEDSDQ
jgi:hypothetical protein